jgi:hypothetical protein
MSSDASLGVHPGLFYPDISAFQQVMDLGGVHAVCIKATEGTYYQNPMRAAQAAKADAAGAFHFAYHFLTNEDPAAQARFCFDVVGKNVPMMADVETETITGAQPTLAQNVEFVKSFRSLGGTIHLNYLPRWYWESPWGSPDLAALKDLDLVLVSSDYSGYSTSAGWQPYGGWTPTIWQYSSTVPLHGQKVDFNAFLGSGATDVPTLIDELRSIVMTGKLPSQQAWQELETTGKQSLGQIASASHMSPAAILRATAIRYGHYDQVTHDYLDSTFSGAGNPTASMPAGAKLWVLR